MKKVFASAALAVAFLAAAAQTTAPQLDSATRTQVQQLIKANQQIQIQVNQLITQKQMNVLKLRGIEPQIEERYPGYRLNEQTGELVSR